MENYLLISKNNIISAIAFFGIKQSPYSFPTNLESALTAVEKRIDEKQLFKSPKKKQNNSYLSISPTEMKSLINDLIFNTPEIAIWNITKFEQDQGFTDPNDKDRPIKLAFTSSDGPMQSEDRDFIDLDALSNNVCGMLMR